MKNILVICICLLSSAIFSQESTEETKYPETVIVKLQEAYAAGMVSPYGSRVVSVDAYNKIDSRDLQRADIARGGKEEFESNMIKFREELQKWHNLGYQIKATMSASPMSGLIITTVILQKN